MYDNAGDASRYLSNTICYWDGKPFYVDGVVNDVNEDGMVKIFAVGRALPLNRDSAEVRGDIDSPKFNALKYQLGYFNDRNGRAVYVSRRPSRIQSQGIVAANLSHTRDNNTRPASREDFGAWSSDRGFADMLVGKYPTLEEARAKMQADHGLKSIAFDKHLCLRRHGNFNNLFYLSYKGEDVSWSEDGAFILPEEFTYLTESCQPKGCLKAA